MNLFTKSLENRTILCPENAAVLIHKQLAEKQIRGVRVLSLNSWLMSFDFNEDRSEIEIKLLIHQQMKQIAEELNQLKHICTTPSFEKECLTFLEKFRGFSLDFDMLPENNELQKELKHILKTLQYPSKNERRLEILNNISEDEIKKLILVYRQSDSFTDLCLRKLIEEGAEVYAFEQFDAEVSFYHAANKRQEIESAIQKIILDQMDCSQVQLCLLDQSYHPLVRQLLERYQLPYTFLSESGINNLALKSANMLRFALDDNQENCLNCLNTNCFSTFQTPFLIQAYQIFNCQWDDAFPDLNQAFTYNLMSERDVETVAALIQKAEEERAKIMPMMQSLTKYQSYRELFTNIDAILNQQAKTDIKAYKKIQRLFADALEAIHDEYDCRLVLEELEAMGSNKKADTIGGILVLDPDDLLFCDGTCFVLGCTQKSFPGFSSESGIFDENYLALIPGYPTLDERYGHFIKNRFVLMNYAPKLIFSYPLNDFEGKNHEASLEIENFAAEKGQSKSILYPLIQKEETRTVRHQISEQTAHALYLNEQRELHGSVSSLERYTGCPYAYFLKFGLRIQEPIDASFNDQKIGTLSHYVLETLVHRYGKDYANVSEQELRSLINEQCAELNKIYPQLNFNLIAEKELLSLMNNCSQLAKMEEHSSLTPMKCEEEFYHEYPVGGGITLKLKGYIDRIDENDRFFRIVDYKSSKKRLVKDKVFSGQQLQLITYAMHCREALNKEALGAFYYSFKNENLSLPYGKLKRRGAGEFIETDAEALLNEQKKAHRLQGWIFSEFAEEMDNEGNYTAGIKNSAKSGITASDVIDPRVLTHLLDQMMRSLATQILSGRIECRPAEDACLFCKYKPICRFNGNTRKPDMLVDIPDNLMKNYGGEDDE